MSSELTPASPATFAEFGRPNLVQKVMGEHAPTFQTLERLRPLFALLPLRALSIHDRASLPAAIKRIGQLPRLVELSRAVVAFSDAAAGKTDQMSARVLVGLMLDGLPSAKNLSSATYIDALIDALQHDDEDDCEGAKGFTPTVLAATVRLVWRKRDFAPSIAEFLTIARAQRRRFQQAAGWASTLWDARENAEDVLIAAGHELPFNEADDGMDDSIPF